MACNSIHRWTVSALVGAYLDLALACLFLCGSTLVFLAAKILAVFGISLPCSCQHGLFSHVCCIQQFLVDRPIANIASIHNSVRTRFPFDSTCPSYDVKFVRPTVDGDVADGGGRSLNMGVEESCISVTNFQPDSKLSLPGPYLDEGKRVDLVGHQPRFSLRRRWRRGTPKSIASSSGSLDSQLDKFSYSPISVNQLRHRHLVDSRDDSADMVEEELMVDGVSSLEEKVASAGARDVHIYDVIEGDGNQLDITRILERELEEMRAAHAALYGELEKERSAAATAADETMAMILRLQEEKASIEMEARQFQRMVEEKSAYVEEEMEILKEIIMRRETEKHFLEKEMEEYRRMLISPRVEMGEKRECPLGFSDDPILMLHQISESMGQIEDAKCEMDQVAPGLSRRHDLKQNNLGDEGNLGFQEKGMLTTDVCSSFVQLQQSNIQETSHMSNREDDRRGRELEMTIPLNWQCNENFEDVNMKEQLKESCSSQFENDSSVLDVHVIDDKVDSYDMRKEKEGSFSQMGGGFDICKSRPRMEPYESRNNDVSSSLFVSNREELHKDIHRSSSDITMGTESIGITYGNKRPQDIRSSMPAVDTERFKLETEVEFLRNRLKVVQQGREKLTLSGTHREKENFQLQLLEDIAYELREIRRMTEPGLSCRHASLPPPSSKATSKRRRCRSASWGVQ